MLQHRQYETYKELFEHQSMETCHSRDTKCKYEPENVLFKALSTTGSKCMSDIIGPCCCLLHQHLPEIGLKCLEFSINVKGGCKNRSLLRGHTHCS